MILSAHKTRHLKKNFSQFGEDAVSEALRTLVREKLVVKTDEGLAVGKVIGGENVLFSVRDESSEQYKEQLLEKMRVYVDHAVRKATAKASLNRLVSLFASMPEEWTVAHFISLYELSYEAVYEEPFRELTQKERGQMKFMLSHFDSSVLQKMVIHFVLDSEKYLRGDAVPTLGLLLYHKDTLKLAVEAKSKKSLERTKMRTSSKKSEDF